MLCLRIFYSIPENIIKVNSVLLIMARKRTSSSKNKNVTKKRKIEEKENVTEQMDGGDQHIDLPDSVSQVKVKTKDGRDSNFQIVSWNVAGVRAWAKKDGYKWLLDVNPDIFSLQEVKCEKKDMPPILKELKNYKIFWNAAKTTKGFSGVALFSKVEPIDVKYGIGKQEHDNEGRTITAEYEQFFLVTTYVPNSQRALKRLDYRMKWNDDFQKYLLSLDSRKPVILCGDMNVSHLEIDLANPKSNKRNAGFTQEERDGMTNLLSSGFIDSYRYLYPELAKKYTFWTYMGNARSKNVGWRLDYFIISERWICNLCDNVIESKVMGSDHCPIQLYFSLPYNDGDVKK